MSFHQDEFHQGDKNFLISRFYVKAFIDVLEEALYGMDKSKGGKALSITLGNLRAIISLYDRYGKDKDLILSFKKIQKWSKEYRI